MGTQYQIANNEHQSLDVRLLRVTHAPALKIDQSSSAIRPSYFKPLRIFPYLLGLSVQPAAPLSKYTPPHLFHGRSHPVYALLNVISDYKAPSSITYSASIFKEPKRSKVEWISQSHSLVHDIYPMLLHLCCPTHRVCNFIQHGKLSVLFSTAAYRYEHLANSHAEELLCRVSLSSSICWHNCSFITARVANT